MGDVIELTKAQLAQLADNAEFVTDLARFADGVLDQKFIRMKYRLAESAWDALGSDTALVEKIEHEKIRRRYDGSTKREMAAKLIVKAPAILDGIMSDVSASPRHRVDAIKTLNDFATPAHEGAPAADRFQITINLGADTNGTPIIETYDKSITINAGDDGPHAGMPRHSAAEAGVAPAEALPAKRPRGRPRINRGEADGQPA